MRRLATLRDDPATVLAALRDALDGSGPAVVVEARETDSTLPPEVPRRVALVVETSGSTASPKRVALSADALLASAAASASAIGGAGQWLLALPVHYIAGLNVLTRSIAARTEPVVLGSGPFDPLAFAEAAATLTEPARFTALVPAQLSRLLDTPAALPALARFDRILVGGQSTPQQLLDRAIELGVRITRTYGSSETSGGCVYDGVPIGNTEVRVVDGEVQLAGAVLADGYLGDDERTAATFLDDAGKRWYRTGDAGTVHEGVLRVTGRFDDVLISGGIKVSVGDIERVVRGMPGQADAVVLAAPHARWGEVPVVVTSRTLELSDVREAVTRQLGAPAAPARVILVDALPMLASGKPDRRAIRALI